MKDPMRSRGVVSEPRPVKEVVKAMRRTIGRRDEDLVRLTSGRDAALARAEVLTRERDEARKNFGVSIAAGAKFENRCKALEEGLRVARSELHTLWATCPVSGTRKRAGQVRDQLGALLAPAQEDKP